MLILVGLVGLFAVLDITSSHIRVRLASRGRVPSRVASHVIEQRKAKWPPAL